MFVQPIGIKQAITGSELPFVASAKGNGDGATFGDAFLSLKHGLDKGPRWINVGFGEVHTQAVSGAGPESAALIFAQVAHAGAGHAFFDAVLDPIALREAVETIIGGDPNASVAAAHHRVYAVKTAFNARPVSAIEFPNFLGCGTPNFAIGNFGETQDRFRSGFVIGSEHPPLFVVIEGGTILTTKPKVAVLRGKKR